MTSHPRLRAGPAALVGTLVAAMIGWLIYLQRQDERATAYVRAFEQRLGVRAPQPQGMRAPLQTLYTCTAKNGFVFTAPSDADLRGLCEPSL